jgi:hypothetical protein
VNHVEVEFNTELLAIVDHTAALGESMGLYSI